MNSKKKLHSVLFNHADLLAILGGVVLSAMGFMALAIAAGFWYL